MKKICHNCNREIRLVTGFCLLSRVTSDARPWPSGGNLAFCNKCNLHQALANKKWKNECQKIYNSYKIYNQAKGAEQTVFLNNKHSPRSRVLVNWLEQKVKLPEYGKILDVGCGNGGFLKEFQKIKPRWELYGTEYSKKNLSILKKIPNFKNLFVSNNQPPKSQFDLVVCIHVLEHVVNPSRFLLDLAIYLKTGSTLLIQVPNANANPFILPVADHASHFTKTSLETVIRKTKLHLIASPTQIVKRELSCLVENKKSNKTRKPKKCKDQILHNLSNLISFANKAKNASKNKRITIFGSSIGATWLFNECQGNISKFIDEDQLKINKTHLGKKIIKLQKCTSANENEIWVPIKDPMVTKKLKNLGYKKVNILR